MLLSSRNVASSGARLAAFSLEIVARKDTPELYGQHYRIGVK